MHWDDVLKEVIKRKANGQKAGLLNDEERVLLMPKQKRVSYRG